MTDTNTPTPKSCVSEICPRCGFLCTTVTDWFAHFSFGETQACFDHMKTRMAELKRDLDQARVPHLRSLKEKP